MRLFSIIISCLWLLLTAACTSPREKADEERLVSVTIQPQRYVAERIAGDIYRINCVIPAGQSPETYDPTPQEMMRIGQSDAYLRIGSIGFEQVWMKAIQEQNATLPVFDLSKGIELVATHEAASENTAGHHHHGLTDPHIWTSTRNMRVIAQNTRDAFCSLDSLNKDTYEANYLRLIAEIDSTEAVLDTLLRPLAGTAFIIYHPALTYLARDYGLEQLCIEMDGKEPSPAQLKALVEAAKRHNAKVVFVQQEFDQKNAEIIARETGCILVPINPLDYNWPESMLTIGKALASWKKN